jgi:DNA polymerase III delta prime subunit
VATPDVIPGDHVASEPQPSPPAAIEPKSSTASESKKPKRRSGSTGPKQATLDAFSLQRETTPLVGPTMSHTPAGSLGNDGNTLEEDPNYDRRKRQRTITPGPNTGHSPILEAALPQESGQDLGHKPTLPWEEQLRLEAEKGVAVAIATEDIPEPSGGHVVPPVHIASGDSESKAVYSKGLEAAAEPKKDVLLEPELSGTYDGTVPSANQERDHISVTRCKSTIPKLSPNSWLISKLAAPLTSKPAKVLQLKNGRLASPPKPKAEPPQHEPEKKRRPGRPKKQPIQRVPTVIKYPESSPEGENLGVKIDAILSGSQRYQLPPPKVINQPRVSATKPSAPIKNPHPFFMGKVALKGATEPDATRETSTKIIKNVEIRGPSPRKLTGTPGKIRAEAEAHRATLKAPTFGQVFGSFQPRMTKYPGMREAPFPWQGVVHSRGPLDVSLVARTYSKSQLPIARRKLKHTLVTVRSSEDLIQQCSRSSKSTQDPPFLRKPGKIITTGPGIQSQVIKELRSRFNQDKGDDSDSDEPAVRRKSHRHASHDALLGMYSCIENELTPFDKYECETQAWTQKYAPRSAVEVLQQGQEATILRDWLKSTTITAVDTGNASALSKIDKPKPEKKKRKRKRPEDLDDFIVGSDDELAGPGELTELEGDDSTSLRSPHKRSLVRGGGAETMSKFGNAVLLSGPNGCGKTAAVYAVAKELGFEIFELNSGSRRSGKDVLDKIGDMTENHLVQQVSKALSENKSTEKLEVASTVDSDVPDTKQGSVTSFFKTTGKTTSTPKGTNQSSKQPEKAEVKQQPRQQQRQSLILLEEVDILFEEDKQFWVTVLALAGNSKRPIIMTCNDESRLPIQALSLHAILRFTPPSIDLAVDYLLLLAAREGHVLTRNAVETLYKSRGSDLRGSIMELDHWCQMGVGDSTGGFGWMLDRYPPGIDVDDQGLTMRVASKDTYHAGMGLTSYDLMCSLDRVSFDKDEALLLEALADWDLQVQDVLVKAVKSDSVVDGSETTNLDLLRKLEHEAEYASALDVSCGLGLRLGYEVSHPYTFSSQCTIYLIHNSNQLIPHCLSCPTKQKRII